MSLPWARVNDGQMIFQVADKGIGIAEDKLEKVFEPFEQADKTITRKFGGKGLGSSNISGGCYL